MCKILKKPVLYEAIKRNFSMDKDLKDLNKLSMEIFWHLRSLKNTGFQILETGV
jgi:hypothetical protein